MKDTSYSTGPPYLGHSEVIIALREQLENKGGLCVPIRIHRYWKGAHIPTLYSGNVTQRSPSAQPPQAIKVRDASEAKVEVES